MVTSAAEPLSEDQRLFWRDNGYLVLRNFFSRQWADDLNDYLNQLWEQRANPDNPLVIDIGLGTDAEQRVLFRDVPDSCRRRSYKLNDAYLISHRIRAASLAPGLSQILAELLGGAPLICNTLNFEFGSCQRFHFDTFYMPPRKTNRMVASWIALDPVDDTNGPLSYYPGSHKIPPYRFSTGRLNAVASEMASFDQYIEASLADRALTPAAFHAQPGDVFIWHAQLYHGGSKIRNFNKPRRSLVTHYFRAQDYIDRFWKIKSLGGNRYYYQRPHQAAKPLKQ